MSFFFNIHGSASAHCDAGRLARAHAFVGAAVDEVLEGGDGVVAFVSGEDLHGSGLPLTFDWSVVQRAHDYCMAQGITEERLRIVTFAASPERRFPASRQQLFDSLTRSTFARIESLDERVRGGDQYRKRIAELSDAVIAIGGGRGVAKLHHDHGSRLTTLPMDIEIGASLGEHDGRGALDLRDAALTTPAAFFRCIPQRFATRLRAIAIASEASNCAAVARESVDLIREDLAKADAIFGKAAEPKEVKRALEKLRILVFAANPRGLDELALGKEATLIEDALGGADVRARVRIDVFWAATADLVARALEEYKPHVIHYAGHGNDKGEPLLLDEKDKSRAVSLSALVPLFRENRSIKCVIFNACYSARVTQELAFDVPVVVGMRDEVSDDVALTFSKRFYGSIGAHKSVRSAFNTSRAAIAAMGLNEEHLPQINAAPDVDTEQLVLLPV